MAPRCASSHLKTLTLKAASFASDKAPGPAKHRARPNEHTLTFLPSPFRLQRYTGRPGLRFETTIPSSQEEEMIMCEPLHGAAGPKKWVLFFEVIQACPCFHTKPDRTATKLCRTSQHSA